jgi:hypothetical protein
MDRNKPLALLFAVVLALSAVAIVGCDASGLKTSTGGSQTSSGAPTTTGQPSDDAASGDGADAGSTADMIDGNFGTFAVVTKSGRGSGVVKVPVDAVGAIVVASHGGSANFVIQTLNESNDMTGLLVNTIGKYNGTTMFTDDEAPVKLKITANGKWTIKIAPVSSAKTASSSNRGSGDAVLIYDGAPADWKFTHKGSGNFAVKYISTSGTDLLVNEIGKYSGVVPAAEGPAVVVIMADGAWTMVAE